MLFTTQMLIERLSSYKVPKVKLALLVRNKKYIPVCRGIYTDTMNVSTCVLAPVIYGPSYISFEYALSIYDLIPEKVTTCTSATFGKNRSKKFETKFGIFTYRDVPSKVYRHEIILKTEEGSGYYLATAEKALCDTLYIKPPVSSVKQFKELLFDDMRIDKERFDTLNIDKFNILAPLYRKKNLSFLLRFLEVK